MHLLILVINHYFFTTDTILNEANFIKKNNFI